MNIEFFCPRWGSEHLGWSAFCEKVKSEGYNGIEYAITCSTTEKELTEVWDLAAKNNLTLIAQHFDTYEADFSRHFDLYNTWMEKIKPFPVVKINSQTGKDYFSFEQNKQLIEAASAVGVPVVHETHRNKFSFAAHITREYLEKIPALQIALDASHWVCVAESFLDDQPEAMQLAIERAAHIHSRVGYPEGPQVPDPRIGEWQEALGKHLHWWDQVVARHRTQNATLTITTEFGPFPYMMHEPASGNPLADQWQVNVFMLQLLKKRYAFKEIYQQ